MGEAKEYFQQAPDLGAESPHRFLLLEIKTRHGLHQAVGHHQQGRLVHVRDQRQQEELMTELAENPALRIREDGPRGVANGYEGVIATHHARA